MVSSELSVAGFQHESNKRSFLAKIQLLEAPKLTRTCLQLQLVPAEQQELSLFRAEPGARQSEAQMGFQTSFRPSFGTDSKHRFLTSGQKAMATPYFISIYCFKIDIRMELPKASKNLKFHLGPKQVMHVCPYVCNV